MIQKFTYRIRVDSDAEQVTTSVTERADRMLKYHRSILDFEVRSAGASVTLTIRVSDTDQVRIAGAARKFATGLLAANRLNFQRPLQPTLKVTEPNGRNLRAGEGRTPRGPYAPRRKKASTSATA